MALDCSADNLYREIEAAERLRDAHVACADQLVRSYVSYNYRRDWAAGDPQPENHAYEFISLMLGRLVADNPQFSCNSSISQYEAIAFALGDALNGWARRENIQDILEAVVLDAFFCFGIVIKQFVPDKILRRMVPKIAHMPYWRYFRDPVSCNGIPARYEGHVWYRDKEDLLKDPRFNQKVLKDLFVDTELEKVTKEYKNRNIPERKQVVGYEIWVPDADTGGDDPDEHGMIYTLGVVPTKDPKGNAKKAFIRAPRPFYGPPDGPYTMFGGWPVPGAPYPLSPLAATKEQADELNSHVIAAAESAQQMKDITLVSADNSGLADVIAKGKHGKVYKVKGLVPGMTQTISIGGPSAQHMEYIGTVRERLDRASGISDAMRGNLDPHITATANSIANQASSVRIDTQVNFVKRAVVKVGRGVAWYMVHSEDFAAHLSKEASQKLGMKQAVFAGGPHPSTEGMRFDDLDLDIQPFSMERVDPAVTQGRVQQLTGMIVQIAGQMPNLPFVNWEELIKQLARAHNANWLTEVISQEGFQQFMQQMQQSAAQQQQPQPEQKLPPMAYPDVPGDVKIQIERMYGLQPSRLWSMLPLADPNQPKQSGDSREAGNGQPLPQGVVAPDKNGSPVVLHPMHAHMLGLTARAGRAA